MALNLEGGCLCGDIRYKVSGELDPEDTPSLCHCRTCQQASGAPVMPWATFNEVGHHAIPSFHMCLSTPSRALPAIKGHL